MTTINDVARRAGVSRATVSAVVNRNKFVSPALTERVLRAIDELDYRPNLIARSLRNSATRTIGLIVPTLLSPWVAFVRGVQDCARQAGYTVLLLDTDDEAEPERAGLRLMLESRVDGLVWAPASPANAELLRVFAQARVPVVLGARALDDAPVDMLYCDDRRGAYEATLHLLRLGRRRVGLLALRPTVLNSARRVEGYRDALRDRGMPAESTLIEVGGMHEEDGYRAALALLPHPDPPDAILSCNHPMVFGVLRAAHELGMRVPEDLAIVGFDELPWSAYLQPPLTTVRQPMHELGFGAAELLLGRIRGTRSGAPEHTVFPAELIVRESCGAPRPAAPAVNAAVTPPGVVVEKGGFITRS